MSNIRYAIFLYFDPVQSIRIMQYERDVLN